MQTIKSYIYGTLGLLYIITCIFCYRFGYKHGSNDITLKVQQATLKQQDNTITKAKQDIAIINNNIGKRESAITKIITRERIVYKPVYEHTICESNVISESVINIWNGE